MFPKKTVRDVPLDGQTVLVRADYNVPLQQGKIVDDYRMTQSLPTLRYLLDRGCQLVICSHLGRPEGKPDPQFSLAPVAEHLQDLLGQSVTFVSDCVGDQVVQAVKNANNRVVLLENLRFHPEEKANDSAFAQRLAKNSTATYFVQDGFGNAHRQDASMAAITQCLPSVAGLLLEREVTIITQAMQNPEHPLMAILGGAKVSDKIKLVERFIEIADKLLISGAMANTFLQYKGLPIGKSKFEPGQEAQLESIYAKALQKSAGKASVDEFIVLPTDVAVSKSIDGPHATRRVVAVKDVAPDDYILDVGTHTIAQTNSALHDAKTVIWNGTLGMAELPPFALGSAEIAAQLASQKQTTRTIIGGGDTADFVLHWDAQKGGSFSHVSTGGGASLSLMAGDPLPGVDNLLSK